MAAANESSLRATGGDAVFVDVAPTPLDRIELGFVDARQHEHGILGWPCGSERKADGHSARLVAIGRLVDPTSHRG